MQEKRQKANAYSNIALSRNSNSHTQLHLGSWIYVLKIHNLIKQTLIRQGDSHKKLVKDFPIKKK